MYGRGGGVFPTASPHQYFKAEKMVDNKKESKFYIKSLNIEHKEDSIGFEQLGLLLLCGVEYFSKDTHYNIKPINKVEKRKEDERTCNIRNSNYSP